MHSQIDNIMNIKQSKIRLFPLQTRDPSFILYQDLPTSYLMTLLIDTLWFSLHQFSIEYVYPFQKYISYLLKEIQYFEEEYFIFYLENYYHSSDYALWFLKIVLKEIEKLHTKPKIFIHTLKTSQNDAYNLIKNYSCIDCIISCDLEYFFQSLCDPQVQIKDINNIIYRDHANNIHINNVSKIDENLSSYIIWAYHKGYYTYFPKSKDKIVSFLDDYKEQNFRSYYTRTKSEIVEDFRFSPDTSIMLTTGRGCKYNCSYCYRWVKYSKVRLIDLDTLKKDLDYLAELKYEYIYFYDDCFITTNLNRIDELIILLSQYKFSYGISVRYEVCSSEILLKLSRVNIKRVQIGLQSISLKVNTEVKRWFHKWRFEKVLQQMKELWIIVSLDIILWLPGEWLKGFLKTFQYAISLSPESIYINTLFLNPWTELYKNQREYGIKTTAKNDFHVSSILESTNFSQQEIIIAKKYIDFYIKKVPHIYIVSR